MGFCPYFLHEYSSGGMSASLLLIAGTLIDLFTLCFLFSIKKEKQQRGSVNNRTDEQPNKMCYEMFTSTYLFFEQ